MSTTGIVAGVSVDELATRYGEAWNRQDLDAIMAMHAPHGAFQLHGPGLQPVVGHKAVREAFVGFLVQLPDIHFEPVRLHTGPAHWVLESVMSGTVAAPIDVDGRSVTASGRRVEVDFLDVVVVEESRVARKDSYLDTLGFQAQLEAAS